MKRKYLAAISTISIAILLGSGFVTDIFSESNHTSHSNFLNIPVGSSGVISGKSDVIGMLSSNTHMNVVVSLEYRNLNQLNYFLGQLQKPSSPFYHKYLSRSQFISEYSPSSSEYSSYVDFFQSHGLTVTSTYGDHVSIGLSGTAAQFENVFHTNLMDFKVKSRTFYAPNAPLSLNVNFGPISGIVGLSNRVTPQLSPLFLGSGSSQTLYGADMQTAYQLDKIFQAKGYPINMTIATILWAGNNSTGSSVAPFVPSDVRYYLSNNLPTSQPRSHVYGNPILGALPPGPSAANDTTTANYESTLDVEMAASAAPGATIVESYGPVATLSSIDQAFASVLNPTSSYNNTVKNALANVVAISNSWGTGSDYNDSTWMQYEQQAAARGITVLASSGDNGNTGTSTPSYPSTMAYNNFGTLSVGGTTMELTGTPSSNGSGTTGILTQSVWYNTPQTGDGSQGGVSSIFTEPSWQLNSNDANTVISAYGTWRGTPDLSADGANMWIYITIGSFPQYLELWGTSVASPLMAGVIADMNLYLGSNEGFLNPALYRLAQAEVNGTLSLKPMYFVYNGSNGMFSAENGYSLAVGWGSINAYNFVTDQSGVKPASTYTVWFNETGLLAGTSWSVDLAGNILSSTSSSISSSKTNGTYSYSIVNPAGYVSSPSTGIVNISGKGVTILVTFSPEYYVSFIESGLPSGTAWYVNITGYSHLKSSSTSISTYLVNGDYSYKIGSANTSFSSPGGSFNVSGSGVTENIVFSSVNYTVSFVESGLPSGTLWYLNLSNGRSNSSTGTAVTLSLINGSYRYEPFSSDTNYLAKGGTVKVLGHDVSVAISFSHVRLYNVTFTESGLPTSSVWHVTISNEPVLVSAGKQITIKLENGSYNFSVTSVNKTYHPAPSKGVVVVSGNTVNQAIVFSLVKYSVTFIESGLPGGTEWFVNITGMPTLSSTNQQIETSLPNGSYSYSVSSSGDIYRVLNSSGIFKISGSSVTLHASFKEVTYRVTFTLTGLPSGTEWYIIVGNHTYAVVGSSITVTLSNGTHQYSISKISGYKSSAQNGSVTVSGGNKSVRIPFTKASGIQIPLEYVAIGLIALVIILGTVAALRRKK